MPSIGGSSDESGAAAAEPAGKSASAATSATRRTHRVPGGAATRDRLPTNKDGPIIFLSPSGLNLY